MERREQGTYWSGNYMKNKRLIYVDILNIICCIAVVGLHMNASSWKYSEASYWKQSLIAEVLLYFAVPVFFMISGATLLGYRERYSTKEFLIRRAYRIVLPYCIWALAYWVISIIFGDQPFSSLSVEERIFSAINAITAYRSQNIFWFIQELINVYLCMPILSLLVGEQHSKLRRYLIGVTILSVILLPLIEQFTPIAFGDHSSLNIAGGYILYILLGYELSTINLRKRWILPLCLASVIVMLIKYLTTIHLSTIAGALDSRLYGYISIWALIPSVTVFYAIKCVNWEHILPISVQRWLAVISGCSLGIYFIHLIIVEVFAKLTNTDTYDIIYRTIGIMVVYCISGTIVMVMKRIPIIKKLVP